MTRHASTPQVPEAAGQAAGLPPPASGDQVRAFTLIEIMAAIALFAMAFAAIAMMLPAGSMMQRDMEARALGEIVGKNSLEVVKGKGVQSLTFDYAGTGYLPSGLNSRIWPFLTNTASATLDLDWALYTYTGYWSQMDGNWHLGSSAGQNEMRPYFDTNGNGGFIYYTGRGYHASDHGDRTNLGLGRIHAFKERPIPGMTSGYFSPLDFSFPSSLMDLTARTYFCSVLRNNLTASPVTNGDQPYGTSVPSTHQWRLSAITMRREQDAEWPEFVESDTSLPAAYNDAYWQNPTPQWLISSTTVDFRSIGGDPSIANKPDPGGTLWPSYHTGGASSQGSVPATGGAPGTTFTSNYPGCDGWFRGWNNDWFGGSWLRWYNNGGGTYGANWNGFTSGTVTVPVREDVASQYGYYPNSIAACRYPVPCPISVWTIVYDRDNDLLLMRYPQCYAKTLVNTGKNETGNPRVAAYRTALGISGSGQGWVDRKLKVGDRFMTSRGAYAFQVKEVLDPVSASATVPGGPVNWSDGTYQIVRVTPPLRNTIYTANKPVGWGNSHWADPVPVTSLVCPLPARGGSSPWVSTQQLNDGGTATTEGAVFRRWDNLSE